MRKLVSGLAVGILIGLSGCSERNVPEVLGHEGKGQVGKIATLTVRGELNSLSPSFELYTMEQSHTKSEFQLKDNLHKKENSKKSRTAFKADDVFIARGRFQVTIPLKDLYLAFAQDGDARFAILSPKIEIEKAKNSKNNSEEEYVFSVYNHEEKKFVKASIMYLVGKTSGNLLNKELRDLQSGWYLVIPQIMEKVGFAADGKTLENIDSIQPMSDLSGDWVFLKD